MTTFNETLTDIGSGIGGLFTQMGSPLAVFLIILSVATGLGLLFTSIAKRITARV